MTPRASLLALALGAFGIGVTEFAPMGMLPSMARDLGVSLSTAGLLISAYAMGVVIGAPLVLFFGGRLSRRTMLIVSMTVPPAPAPWRPCLGYEQLLLAHI